MPRQGRKRSRLAGKSKTEPLLGLDAIDWRRAFLEELRLDIQLMQEKGNATGVSNLRRLQAQLLDELVGLEAALEEDAPEMTPDEMGGAIIEAVVGLPLSVRDEILDALEAMRSGSLVTLAAKEGRG